MRPGALVFASVVAAWPHATTRADGPSLPAPPRQAEAWTPPPTRLPKFVASTTAALCVQGLADPRGCAYRRIKLAVGSVWGGGVHEVETSGWVIPPPGSGKPRHAIAWNGLVYPLAADLGPADLDVDVRALVDTGRPTPEGPPGRPRGLSGFGSNDEGASVSVATSLPIKICLLLRLGRADLAESAWDAATGRKPDGAAGRLDQNSYGISYLTLARDLAWYRFDRAICAHMRGDDPLALADARALMGLVRAVEIQAEAMGFDRPQRTTRGGEPAPYIDFLDQLPDLLADQERRAWERDRPPAAPPGDGPEAKVAALIRQLDQVRARQWGQPGGVVLGESPIIKDLIAQGDAAVEPLIRAFRTEDRLTRSVGFHRDFFRSRTIIPADRAAFTALTGILKVTNFAPPSPDGPNGPRTRDDVADEIRAYWDRNRAIPPVERWYRTLADDQAGPQAWLESAGNIIQPENVRTVPGGGAFTVTETTQPAPGVKPKLRGEPLRKGHEPSVAALMARRVRSMLTTPEGQRFELLDPCRMASILAAWDPVEGLPTLRDMTRICRERYARPNTGHGWTNQNLAVSIARFTLARDGAGDRDALREYAEWVRTTSPEWLENHIPAVLEPLRSKPDDPALAAASAWLFGDPKSPWIPLVRGENSRATYHLSGMIASPLVEVPAFRSLLIRTLEDHAPVGRAEAGENGAVTVRMDAGFVASRTAPEGHADDPAPGTSSPIRACDFVAWQLASRVGAPSFNPCWPSDRRDAAIAAMAEFLRNRRPRRPATGTTF